MMPRVAKKQENSGIYRIMMRELIWQQVFENDKDGERFLEGLKRIREKTNLT